MMCKMELTSLHDFEIEILRFVTFVHLPFSIGSLDLFVASLVFMKGTSCCKDEFTAECRAVGLCYGCKMGLTRLHDFYGS